MQWKSSLQCISEMNRLFSEKSQIRLGPAPDVLLELDTVRKLSSGVSRYLELHPPAAHPPLQKYIPEYAETVGGFLKHPLSSSVAQVGGSQAHLLFSRLAG